MKKKVSMEEAGEKIQITESLTQFLKDDEPKLVLENGSTIVVTGISNNIEVKSNDG